MNLPTTPIRGAHRIAQTPSVSSDRDEAGAASQSTVDADGGTQSSASLAHTTGPWVRTKFKTLNGANHIAVISTAEPDIGALALCGLEGNHDEPLSIANAERIVQCVNAHDDLLEALRVCVETMEFQEGREQERFHLSAEAFIPMWTAAIRDARAAIAKATGAAA